MKTFDMSFYKGKKVLITGHTGFKGSWMCLMLLMQNAKIIGYSNDVPTSPSLFDIAKISDDIVDVRGDIRDLDKLMDVFNRYEPEIVIHMAAQPIVRTSYEEPVMTFETNVMGTVNVLECVRKTKSVKSFVNVTTDKVYKNNEWEWGYRENDELFGFDPYSNSKSCSELATKSYRDSFFEQDGKYSVAISTLRAGNVIGGGDFAKDRIIPDCVRSAISGKDIVIRNPNSIRPYQFVLEPVYAYLMIAAMQYEEKSFSGSYNIGPDDEDTVNTRKLVETFCRQWNLENNSNIGYVCENDNGPHEASFLKLDTTHIKNTFSWKPRIHLEDTMKNIICFTKVWQQNGDVRDCMNRQIEDFLNL